MDSQTLPERTSPPPLRLVLDTNLLVAQAYNARSASRLVVDYCLEGHWQLVVSSAILREYRLIARRALHGPARNAPNLQRLLDGAEHCEPQETPRLVPDDPDDDKFLAAAMAGNAHFLLTNDQHLLVLNPFQQCRIIRPGQLLDELGLGRPS